MKKFIYEERSIGKLILLIGVLLAVPLLVLPFYPEDAVYMPAFLISGSVLRFPWCGNRIPVG